MVGRIVFMVLGTGVLLYAGLGALFSDPQAAGQVTALAIVGVGFMIGALAFAVGARDRSGRARSDEV
ncbi:hypothetical protein HII36_04625 [Nonomuraea sp. NN258]|uniref:hypothetical protein n=1 Tax=Nonomuraea antri TaxID=2730852 RepID=UPI00156A5680|nr:hypothetical protein [Nonomuraea antri]NRQ31120.1 hypothetical protein [Nonomuraea antri]